MTRLTDIPAGFTPIIDPDRDAPGLTIVETDCWSEGALMIYRGVRSWTSGTGEHRAQTFSGPESEATTLVGVWSTAVLDRLLSKVPVGQFVFIRYDGKTGHPTLPGRHVHNWTVAAALTNAGAPARA